MKLILTDYISSLKEDRELDTLLIDLLREYDFEIIYGPSKGQRQYGVDIYALGQDPEDNLEKVFLLTVKQGNLDRKNWHGSPQALEPSLREIATAFVRNNLALEHRHLPIKIIIAHNGFNDSGIQQNWVAFAEEYPRFQFAIWQLETIVNMVHEKMIDEKLLSDSNRAVLRKIIIYLFNPDYDLGDYKKLLDELLGNLVMTKSEKRNNIKCLTKVNLILSIIISYCERENDARLALKASEITLLRIWKVISDNKDLVDEHYLAEFIQTMTIRSNITIEYLEKVLPVCEIKDGFSRNCGDAITYNMVAYESLGFIALAGLEFIQMGELIGNKNTEAVAYYNDLAYRCMNGVINIFNNNRIVFNPRADNQIIEVNLAFLLLFKFDKINDIRTLLIEFNNRLAHAKLFLNIAPHYYNNTDEIFDLEVNYKKRETFEYHSSSLLTTLFEWTLAINDSAVYDAYVALKSKVFSDIELTLWFPDGVTEEFLYTEYALPKSGYCLTNIHPSESFDNFKQRTLIDYIYNCYDENFFYNENQVWAIGLLASRHYRTYVFPSYWRRLIENHCPVTHNTI